MNNNRSNRTMIDLETFVGAMRLALEAGDVVSFNHYVHDFAFDDHYAYPIRDWNYPKSWLRETGEVLQ